MTIVLKRIQSLVYYRYYHVFCQGELEGLIEQIKSLEVRISTYDSANWFMLAEKIESQETFDNL